MFFGTDFACMCVHKSKIWAFFIQKFCTSIPSKMSRVNGQAKFFIAVGEGVRILEMSVMSYGCFLKFYQLHRKFEKFHRKTTTVDVSTSTKKKKKRLTLALQPKGRKKKAKGF